LFRNVSSRFFGRGEKQVLRLLKEHLDQALGVVRDLRMLILSIMNEEMQSSPTVFETKIKMISIQESFADDSYLRSLMMICDGAFFSGLREDFLRLFESIDDIADFAKDSSQILARSRLDEALKNYCRDEEAPLHLFLDKIVRSVEVLEDAIHDLDRDASSVIKKSIEVKELEEEADDIKWKLLEAIFSHKREMDVLTLLELKDLVLTLDEIADAAARSSETLIMIIMKARA